MFRLLQHPRLAPLRARVRAVLAGRVRGILAERSTQLTEADADLFATRRALSPLDRSTRRAAHRLDRGPIHAEMTVHAVHDRDPRVTAVFARRGLPRCLDCAVGGDETLREAAAGEGFALDELLAELNDLR